MSGENWVHGVFTKWRIGCLLQVCIIILGVFILSIYYFHAWQLQRCAALWKKSKKYSTLCWLIDNYSLHSSVQSHAPLSGWFFHWLQVRKEKPLPEFVTAETSAFDWQASPLSGQTEPISLISPMVFPGFVSTRLGFVSKDLSFTLLFKNSLGLASLFHCKSDRK